MSDNLIVKASEIRTFTYCKREWWLQFNGKVQVTEAMELGTAGHNAMARSVQGYSQKRNIALLCIGIGILLLVIYLLVNAVMR